VFVFLSQRRFRFVPLERRRRRCTRSDAFAKASRSHERLCSPWTSSPSPPPPPPPPPTSSRASPCRAGGTSASARARTPCRRGGGGLGVCGRKRVIMGERVSSGKKVWMVSQFRQKNLHTARPTVTLRCGTEATYPLRWRSRTPARRGPAGRRPARHPAVAGSKTRRRSRRRSREVRQIPRVIRPRFARDLISLLHSFRPGCRERRGRAGRVRETTRARRTCSSLDSSDDSLPSVDRGA
jgi:hypothetical protein